MPEPNLFNGPIWQVLLIAFSGHLLRYFLMAGGAFLILFKALPTNFRNRFIIGKRRSTPADYQREILWSLQTALFFGLVAAFVVLGSKWGIFKVGFDSEYREPLAFWGSLLGLIFFHDFYFYWIHRWMHLPGIYERVHLIHHKSVSPTPWTAYSFHPAEAFLEAMVVPIYLIFVPMHVYATLLFQILSMAANIYNHLGFEFSPKVYSRIWPIKWINRPLDHHFHHDRFKGNYGFYFNFWDRLMKTYQQPEANGLNAIARDPS